MRLLPHAIAVVGILATFLDTVTAHLGPATNSKRLADGLTPLKPKRLYNAANGVLMARQSTPSGSSNPNCDPNCPPMYDTYPLVYQGNYALGGTTRTFCEYGPDGSYMNLCTYNQDGSKVSDGSDPDCPAQGICTHESRRSL
ncbi:hypothetical protein HMN09_00878900 [Mycena chlorophos]|uniref:Uncharacterized protein n=1 Tax=Mycena chlorophos TaxID=658473 RepID=A0A8H6W5F9_MYCCL|nr:hypothetical protein HMN09_00878900 [Mycena chlorophos]